MPKVFNEREDIEQVKAMFSERGLEAVEYSGEGVGSRETPDLEIRLDGELVAYCEVKSPGQDTWLEDQFARAEPGEIVGGARDDPIFNRLSTHIYKAAKQLDTVNPDRTVPNILVMVNHDNASGPSDLYETVTGHFLSDDGTHHPTMLRISEGRIREGKQKIDLFIWIDLDSGKTTFFPTVFHPEQSEKVKSLFDI
jgi:hypothetical protein